MWDVVDVLIRRGANVNVKGEKYFRQSSDINTTVTGRSGQTGLIMAIEKEDLYTINVLIKAGADVNVTGEKYIQHNFRKLTPLLQVPPVKQHLPLQRREECGTLLTPSSRMVLQRARNIFTTVFKY